MLPAVRSLLATGGAACGQMVISNYEDGEMKPVLVDGKLSVELNTLERKTLEKAREIAKTLDALHQTVGATLVMAIDEVLSTKTVDEPEE